ncbi:hypothetical protein GmHk_19G054411 [Glycine max]|nr:hypothetical protein GmHk_19G054411 [Glycine max]
MGDGRTLRERYPDLYQISSHKAEIVGNLGSFGEAGWQWNFSWRRNLFDHELVSASDFIDQVSALSPNATFKDQWVWGADPKGTFSTSSAYHFIREAQSTVYQNQAFSQLWDIKAPPKALSFAWRLLWDRLPTKDNLSRRQVALDSDLCTFCQSQVESASHLFFSCNKIMPLWWEFTSWVKEARVMHCRPVDHFIQHLSLAASQAINRKWKVWWVAATVSIWNYRNAMIFKNQQFAISKLVGDAIYLTWSWLTGWEKDFVIPFNQWSSSMFFSVSLILFFILWHSSSAGYSKSNITGSTPLTFPSKEEGKIGAHGSLTSSFGWDNHGWFYISVRIGLFLWVALLNLITISSTWARVTDVMDSESGSRLFGFIGAGATLGQLFGSLFAIGMAFVGPFLLLFAALLMELAAQTSRGINHVTSHVEEQLSPIRKSDSKNENKTDEIQKTEHTPRGFPKSSTLVKLPFWPILEGLWLILSSTYLLHVSLFIWLSAVVSSFFYFQKVSVIATTVTSSLGRRKLFAQINSFIAVFILVGQLSLTVQQKNNLHQFMAIKAFILKYNPIPMMPSTPTECDPPTLPSLTPKTIRITIRKLKEMGRILTVAGVTTAICSAPFVGLLNLVALAVWPKWVVVAICETLRKVVTYVVTRPGRELLFTVVSEDEKYKAKVCIDVLVQRLGDAAAAGMYKMLFGTLNGNPSTVPLYGLPVCLFWIVTAFSLGRRQVQLSKHQISST